MYYQYIDMHHWSNSQNISGLLIQKGITGPIVRISMGYYYIRVSLVQQSGYLWTISTGYHWSNSQDLSGHLVQKAITNPIVRISIYYQSRRISPAQLSGHKWTISPERFSSQDLGGMIVQKGINKPDFGTSMDCQSTSSVVKTLLDCLSRSTSPVRQSGPWQIVHPLLYYQSSSQGLCGLLVRKDIISIGPAVKISVLTLNQLQEIFLVVGVAVNV